MAPLTTWVKRLLIANVVIFLLAQPGSPLYQLLVLYPLPFALFRPWGVVTYMFLHAGMGHLFFNMIGLFFFGPRLENRLGAKGFLWLYFLAGLGGAVFHLTFNRTASVVGASGAGYGILLGFAMFWPRERIYIWGILPVEAWLLASLLVFGSLYSGISPSAGSGTAHFAHLGGIAFAFAFLKWWEWKKGSAQRSFQKQLHPQATPKGVVGDKIAQARWEGISLDGLHELNREEVERLLGKVESDGSGTLTPSERTFLDRMSSR
ncbi:MAG: rhomboid family intramembrane serine protease [Gemmatimonadales bacterium]|nr:rhomboid family intramembrane serine protease [Gemmatimonadales bacterium]